MDNILGMIVNFVAFCGKYGMLKCMKALIMGLVMVPFILIIRLYNRNKYASIDFYAVLLVLPMAFTGMCRFFYNPHIYFLTGILYKVAATTIGVIYFAVMFVLLFGFLHKNNKLRRWVRGLGRFNDEPMRVKAVEKTLGHDLADGKRWFGRNCIAGPYLNRVRIYVTDKEVSPFSGGIWNPYVVIPEHLFNEASKEEQLMILCHELMHIKSGHIVWLFAFRLLWIYWWINPVMFWLNSKLRDDMERVCDEKCIGYTNTEPYSYGAVLLFVAGSMCKNAEADMVSFVGSRDYDKIKKRISYIELVGTRKCFFRKLRTQTLAFALVCTVLAVGIWKSSYPRYSVIKELFLYDENINLCIYDAEELQDAVKVKNGRLIINHDKFDGLIKKNGISGDCVYIGFDTICKVPGWGGGGNVGVVSLDNYNDIYYLSKDCLLNDVMEFWLKYLI